MSDTFKNILVACVPMIIMFIIIQIFHYREKKKIFAFYRTQLLAKEEEISHRRKEANEWREAYYKLFYSKLVKMTEELWTSVRKNIHNKN